MKKATAIFPKALVLLGALATFTPLAWGQTTLTVTPELPRANDQIELRATFTTSCFAGTRPLSFGGDRIRLTVLEECSCADPTPQVREIEATIGFLVPGIYTLELFRQADEPISPACPEPRVETEREILVTGDGRIRALRLEPERPTADDEVRLIVDLEPEGGFIYLGPRRSGPLIRVVGWVFHLLDPPSFITQAELPLGKLPAGEYAVLLERQQFDDPNHPAILDLPFHFEVLPGSSTDLNLGQRFRISARWTSPGFGAGEGQATALPLTDNSGYFWFFQEDNAELMVKVLDGCDVNGFVWVFAAGLTNVGVEILVEDLETGIVRTYETPLGEPFSPLQDVRAFDACPTG